LFQSREVFGPQHLVQPSLETEKPALGFSALSRFNVDSQKVIVDKHNDLRRAVNPTARNMLKMVWNLDAANNAQRWADQCKMSISPRNERVVNGVFCGENILQATYPQSWSDAIQTWYNQVANFKYGTGAVKDNAPIGSYTQVVWYHSYQIGCAVAYCPQNKWQYFYVCQYCPAGNNAANLSKPYKQGPACGDCPNACDRGLCSKLMVFCSFQIFPEEINTNLCICIGALQAAIKCEQKCVYG
uniref:Cysteine rich secretory protein 2 n=1 Tax=Terrapene triunguis TaxID=2587831 RepID=A0A674ISM9_9SAUR